MLGHLLDRKVAPKEAQKMCSKGTAQLLSAQTIGYLSCKFDICDSTCGSLTKRMCATIKYTYIVATIRTTN